MMALAPAIGALSALIGLYISWSWDYPTGGTIVLVLPAMFLVAWFLAPRHGLIARRRLQTLAAGSSSAALGLIAAGLSNIGLRGLADRLVTTRVEWVTPRLVKLTAASVALAILVAVVSLAGPDAPA